jgi:hypothetical protein
MVDLVGIHPATDCNGRSTRGIAIVGRRSVRDVAPLL